MAIKVVFSAGRDYAEANGLYQWDYGQTLEIECAEIGYEILEVHFASPNMTMAVPRPCTFINGVGTVPIPDQCLEQANTITAWICRIDDTQSHTIKTISLPLTARTKPIRTHEVPVECVDKYAELIEEVGEAIADLTSGNISVAKATFAETANRANTAALAQNASHAITAQKAETVNYTPTAGSMKMTLVSSCAITEGVGVTPGGLEFNTPYLVVYESDNDYVGSGLLIASSTRTMNHCPISHIYGVRITVTAIHRTELSGCDVEILDDNYLDGPISTENGTLYFYTFGKI